MISLPEGYALPATDEELLAECDVTVFHASGPGGQSVNTADSAVRLKHRPTGVVVVGRRERSQLLNKRDCLRRLRARLVELMAPPPPPRRPTKPSRAAHARRIAEKNARGRVKSMRRTPPTDE